MEQEKNKVLCLFDESLKQFEELKEQADFLINNYRDLFDKQAKVVKQDPTKTFSSLLSNHYEGYLMALDGKEKATNGKLKIANALEKMRQWEINLEMKKQAMAKDGSGQEISADLVRDMEERLEKNKNGKK